MALGSIILIQSAECALAQAAASLALNTRMMFPFGSLDVLCTGLGMSSPPLWGSLKKVVNISLHLLVSLVIGAEQNMELLSAFLSEMKISFSCASAEVAAFGAMGQKALVLSLTALVWDTVSAELLEYFLNMSFVLRNVVRIDEDVIQVDYDYDVNNIHEDVVHKSLKNCWCISKPFSHYQPLK